MSYTPHVILHNDQRMRCPWCGTDPLYVQYHDQEWGVPKFNSDALFEMLVLESFQSGLSWITILRKRDNFRKAFNGFNPYEIAGYTYDDFDRLVNDAGIIRNRLKIISTIQNAKAYLELENTVCFSDYIWGFVEGKPIINKVRTMHEIQSSTPLSKAISKDMIKRGFKFVGPTVIYAYMQAIGMVNDHLEDCYAK